jgi:[ribosomal protein S18]-alanine N-acetyltransferase
MREITEETRIRVAGRSDRLAICSLLRQAWHSAGGAGWDQLDALQTGCGALLVDRGNQSIGVCLLDLRTPPVARLSAVAVADREDVPAVWEQIWRAAEIYLRNEAMRFAYYVGEAPWLLDMLNAHGFEQVNTVVAYERGQDAPIANGHATVRLRSAREADLTAVEELDAASFPLLWRYPLPMLQAAMQPAARFSLAELDRRLIGYLLSTQEGNEGQITRLAVLPDYRRQGIGSRLLADALSTFRRGCVRRVSLNTQDDNVPAQRLYERFGFRRTGDELPVLEKPLAP